MIKLRFMDLIFPEPLPLKKTCTTYSLANFHQNQYYYMKQTK